MIRIHSDTIPSYILWVVIIQHRIFRHNLQGDPMSKSISMRA